MPKPKVGVKIMNSQIHRLEEKNDKIITLKSKTFGEIELRYISATDLTVFAEFLDKLKDSREFVTRVLYNQLTIPKVSFTEFNKIPDDELVKIARDFAKHDQHIFQYFRETTDAELFTNFRKAIFRLIVELSIKSLKNFNERYANIIKHNIAGSIKLIETISEISEQFRESQLPIVESLRSAIEQLQLANRIVSGYLAPWINFWRNWVKENREIFDTYRRFWQTFLEQYKITEQEAIYILRKYRWFITPSLPVDFIFKVVEVGKRKDNQRKAINKLFVTHFSENDFENLARLVDGWETNAIFKPRMKIFRDCVPAIRNAKGKYNPSTIVLPTLIAQIDGIQRDFMERNGLSFNPKKRKWTDKNGNVFGWREWFKTQTINQGLLDLAGDIFLNILFQNSQRGKPLKTPFTFNRHKIMHGECLRYGRIDNTIRAFLILDFLSTLGDG